jgi:hypothetical protein
MLLQDAYYNYLARATVTARRTSLECGSETSVCTSEGLSTVGTSVQLTGELGKHTTGMTTIVR